ncbi:nesprin-1-like [Lingula anatina]|uniref:Nesprin-1-like n=1 Tax=Lingula anatina TaxID=7574 RepID=A0A2R2MQ62_LINAN|nr:nesprin-1-like [Lingula anatina]|eukprot:XP_023932384.1 nesprin-1-like [Lingula anatina]
MSRIQDTAERLFPTLDPNDKETLQQSVEALNQKLTDVLKAAAKRQKQLEDELKNWNEFQGQLEDASQTVKELELKWENVDTTAAATSEQAAKQLVQIENFTEAVQKRAAVLDQMNQKARELTRSGNQNSQTVITRMIAGINERWRTVSSQADERQIVLREYVTEWHLFYQIYERFEHFLLTIEERMPKEDAIKLTTAQLQVQMSDCQTIKTELEKQHSEIGKMQKAAQAILSKLPSSDARIAVQRKMVAAQDRYDKLHKEATDIQQTALGEVQTRDTFLQELHLTLQWLQEAQARSQSLTQGDLHTRTEKYKALQREVILKTEHLKTLVHKQREKYRALSRDLPPELITEIEVYKQAEEATVKQLKESEKQLDHAKQSKIEYHDMVKTVNTWLTNAEEKVQDKDGDLEETNQKHQQLCVELELFKTQPEQLESKASEVINLTDDPKERSSITKTVNSVNDRWARLLQKAAERTEHLQEALDLWDSFESSHIVVSSQLTRTETVVCTELAWASLERVKQQLQEHRALLENAPEIDSKLEAMSSTVRQLSDICNARSVSNKLSDLQDQWFTVKTQVSERTAILEETVGEWEQYEKEMADIGKWMEETKHSMHLKDTTLSLKEQLAAQERLLSDIKKHGSKANTILARHEELRCMAGDFSPTRGAQLSTEIARLQNEAKDQYEKLVSAIAQQEKYEAEISRLTLLITEAQQKLTTSPVVASSVEGLKKQIAEHNTLTAQIKTYQEKIREINEQSLQLQERTQQMSPTIRKKFNWGSERSLASDETGLMSSLSSESIATRKTSQGQPPGDWKEHRTDSGIMMTPEGSISSKETQRRGADSLRPGDAGGTALREMVESAMHGRSNTPSGGWSASSAETVLERRAPDRESSGKGKSQEMEPPEKIPKIREVDEDVPDAGKSGKKSDRQKSKHVTDNSDQLSIKSDDTDNLLEEYSNAMAARDMTDGTVKDPEAGEEPVPSDSLRKMVESAMRDRKSPVQEQLVTEIEGARAMEVEEAEIFPQKKPQRAQVDTEIRESPDKENLEQLLSPERVLTVPEDTESLSDQASVSSDLMATLGSPVKPADLTVSTLGETTMGDVSMSASGPGSPNKMAQLAELNSSWNSLQVQLGVKEQQLQEALHKQEQYQDALQDVTSNIEQVRLQVDALSPETTEDLESMVTQCQVLMTHIEEIKTKLAGVRSLGQQMSSSSEPEGPRVMQATLVVLTDRLESLQSMTRTRMRQTEMKLHDQQKHQADLQEYQTNIEEFDEWLTTARLENSDEAMTDPDTATLKQQLEKNKNLQAEVNKRLQQLSDMAVQCESLMELGSSEGATGLRSRVSELKAQVTEFKLQIIDGQRQIKDKIRDVERQALSAEEESSMQELQQWMEDTRRMTLSPKKDETGPKLVEENYQLQQQLETDLAKHQRLIRSVSTSGVNYVEPKDAPFEARADVVQANWDRLAKMAADKKQQAEEVINRARSEGKPLAIYQKGQRSVHEPGTTTKTEEVKIGMLELTQCWERLQRPDQDDETRSERLLQFQRQFQETILTLSEWMDLIEVKLFAVDHDRTAEEQLKENESVMKELRSVQEDVKELGRTSHHILPEVGEEEKQMVKVTMENMGKRLQVLERRGYDQEQELMEKTRKWKHYQTEVKSLQSKLTETRRHFITSAQSVAPLEQQLAEIKKLEDSIKQYEQKLHKLSQEGEELSEGDPRAILPVEMNTLHTSWQQLQQQATERKAQLQRAMTVQSQYEKMIQEYAEFLDTAQDKLRADTLAASDLQHLAQQLKAHKEFFSDLEGHRSMLDALAQKTDKATRQRYFSMHTRLINLTHIVQDKASLRGQRIERIVEEWAQFEDQFNQTNEWLLSLEKQSPVRTTGDETAAIRQHQFVQKRLNDEKAAMYQVVEKGKQLAQRVKCPALETNVATFAERWVAINNATNQELKWLEVLLDQQTTFDHDAGTLEEWLATAKEKAGEFVLKDEDVKDIGAIRGYIDRFLEFRKEVEHQSPLKNKVMLTGNQILRTRKTDSSGLLQRLNSIEESWLQLTTQLTSCEDRLHQAQMELMPSRQALSELLIWISGLEKVLKDDKNIPLDSALDTKIMLTKYRGFKVDISNKQLTVDFVNQSALEMSIRVPHGHQAEKTDFAEKLGQMNRRWQAAASDVAERLKTLEMLQVRWEEYEKCVKGLMEWFDDQENKIKKYHRIGHEISIRQTLKDCKSLEEQLKVKEDEIESVKKLGLSLMESSKGSSDSIHDVKTTVDKLNQHWACLDHQVCQVQNVLEDTLRQWETYQASLQVVSQLLTETEYLLSRYNVVSGDATTFKSQLLRLKGMQKEFDQQGSKLKQFLDDGDQLIKVCEPFVTQGLQRAVTDVKSRWDSLVSQLRTRVSKYEGILEKWQKYEADYTKAKDWVEKKEIQCNELLLLREEAEDKDGHLNKSKELKQELDNFQTSLLTLNKASDQLTKNMDNTTIIGITSRETALSQRVSTMRQALLKHTHNLQNDLSQQRRFDDLIEVIQEFFNDAERVLEEEDPNKSADEDTLKDRLEELKALNVQFNNYQSKLDNLNNMGYRLPLSKKNSEKLKQTNQKWYKMFAETSERYRTMQGHMLLHHDFQQKCDAWMTFLAQAEQNLAVDIAGNYEGLLEQQKIYELFQSEIYSRQQILQSIISDGHQMMRDSDSDERQEFQRKLSMLDQQWQSVVRRTNQRKAIIDHNISHWQMYKTLREKLSNWLDEMDENLNIFEFSTATLQKIKALIEHLRATQKDLAMHESMYQRVHEAGCLLVSISDKTTESTIRSHLTDIQQHWFQIIGKLDGRREHLEGILKQWQGCEEGIEDILAWLKEMRKALNVGLAQNYDDLQRQLQQCVEFETAFANAADKRKILLEKEHQLALVVSPDDLTILRQRIVLLTKQWDEIANQIVLRRNCIEDRLNEWTLFNDKYREMLDWLSYMEAKVSSNQEFHIEDILEKLQKDYKEEITNMQVNRDDLFAHGHRLIKSSSEVRANDIEYKISKLRDRWQRLQELVTARLKKLQETLTAVQELEKSMASLRRWLAYIEHALSSPVSYQQADLTEIHRRLQQQQEHQQDIERHSAGVASVLNLCQVLLHDTDACPTDVEVSALQHAKTSLDRRWKNIRALSTERRMRIEETWRLWQKFSEDYHRFVDWMKDMEKATTKPRSASVTFAEAKEELRKFELQDEEYEELDCSVVRFELFFTDKWTRSSKK